MKNVKCVHPIKVNRIIREFLEDVIVLPIDIEIESENTSDVYYAVDGDINNEDEEIIVYVPNWRKADYKNDFGGQCFRKDFIERCPMAKGFSDVTISLLHEVGHTMTKGSLPKNYNREKECAKVDEIKDKVAHTFAYFKMTDEVLATNWAIAWLSDAENRKTAKAFEKKFWTCFTALAR